MFPTIFLVENWQKYYFFKFYRKVELWEHFTPMCNKCRIDENVCLTNKQKSNYEAHELACNGECNEVISEKIAKQF